MQRKSPSSKSVTRRTLLKTSAVGGIAMVAGCSGSKGESDNNDKNTNTEKEADPGKAAEEMTDRYLRIAEWLPLNSISLNYWAPGYASGTASVVTPRFAQWSATHSQWMAQEGKNWMLDKKNAEFRIEMYDGQFWSDGQPHTAKDWAIFYELNQRMVPRAARPNNPLITGFTTDGDLTVVAKLNSSLSYNKAAITSKLLTKQLGPGVRKESFFHDMLTKLRNATTKTQRNKIRRKVTNKSLTLPDVQCAGPYDPVKVTANLAVFETNPDHKIVKVNDINWTGVKAKYLGKRSAGKVVSALDSNKIDMSNEAVPVDVSLADNEENIINSESGGIALEMNYGIGPGGKPTTNDPLMDIVKDRRVRRAMMYVIDRDTVAQSAMAKVQQPVGIPCGLTPSQVKHEFPDLYPKLDHYKRTDKNVKKAEELMKKAGCTRNASGDWLYDGKQITFTLITIPDAEYPGAGQAIASYLKNFGIKVKFSVLSGTEVDARVQSNRAETHLGVWGYGVPALYQAFTNKYDPQSLNWCGKLKVKAPKEVGNWNASLREWNVAEMVTEMHRQPLSEVTPTVRDLIWVTNYAQPYCCLLRDASGQQCNTATFEWPDFPPKQENSHFRVATKDDPMIYGLEAEVNSLKRGWAGPKYKMQAEPMD